MKQVSNINILQIREVAKRVTSNTFKIKPLNEMKKITLILFVALVTIFSSCEGPMGIPGAPGEDAFIGSVFEIQGDFTSDNNYNLYTEYPSSITVYDSDVVLVYILWEVADGIDVWRLLPQTVVLKNNDSGETDVLLYNFDYTSADVQVFLEFTFPSNELLPAETDNQVFRIAVLPADFAALKSVDVSDFNSILKAPDIELKSFDKIELGATPSIEIK